MLELLLTTHFANSDVTQELAAPAGTLLAICSDWRSAARVVTYRRIEWDLDYFAKYKIPGMCGIFRPCCKRDGRLLSHTWSEYCVPACLILFPTYGNYIWLDFESTIKLITDNRIIYKKIMNDRDIDTFQLDIDILEQWTVENTMKINAGKVKL
jgi:hypothetical protein